MMKGQLAGLMKQAQAMQDNMKKMQEKLAATEVTGESGAGLVKVIMTGDHAVKRVILDKSLREDDIEMEEDLITAAFADAKRKADELSQQMMGGATAGMGLPPGFKLPF
jgi:DNA-binding YbaB/EbfC family protein